MNNICLNSVGTLIWRLFSINALENFGGDLQQLEKTFSLAYLTVRIYYIKHKTYETCINQLLPLRLPVNSRLLSYIFADFQLHRVVVAPNPCIVQLSTKDQCLHHNGYQNFPPVFHPCIISALVLGKFFQVYFSSFICWFFTSIIRLLISEISSFVL